MNKTIHFIIITFMLVMSNCMFISELSAQFTIKENFQGSSVGSSIVLGGTPSAYLTSGIDDPVNEGWLRLTNCDGNQKGFAYINSTFPSTLGVLIDIEYKIWRSKDDSYDGADGIGIFFFDANSTFRLGGYGGSLGYAPNTPTTSTGLAGGYMGIGLDEYGNFSNHDEGRNGGPGVRCNSVTLRGPTTNNANTTNPWLATRQLQTNSALNNNSIDYNTTTATRPSDATFYRRVKISIVPTADGKYQITVVWRTTPTGADVNLIDYITTQAPPAYMKVGFAASTGGGYNYHEIRNVLITTPGGVRVDKDVDKSLAKVGDQLTYTINAYNSTTSLITNLLLSDTIRDGNGNLIDLNSNIFTINSIKYSNNGNSTNTATDYTTGTPYVNGTIYTKLPGNGGFTNPFSAKLNMTTNSTSTFTVVGTIKNLPAGGGVIKNSVGIDPVPTGITDEDLTNNYYSTTTNVLNADFVINNTVNNSCADPTNGNTYTLLVSNNGTENSIAGNTVTVTDTIPSGFLITGTVGTGWVVSNTGNIYTFTRSDVLVFGQAYPPITINFKPLLSGTSWVNRAGVKYSGIEATIVNNNSNVILNALPAAPVVISPVIYCEGNTAIPLTAAGTNLMWYNIIGGAGSSAAPTPNTVTVGTKTYYVSQNNGMCESALTPIVVTVNPEPITSTIYHQ